MRKISARTTVFGMLVAGVLALGGVSAAPASASTGGGCNWWSGNGFTIEVCISASGNQVRPDMYVTAVGPNCHQISIYTEFVGSFYDENDYPCATGHYYGTWSTSWGNGDYLNAYAQAYYPNFSVADGGPSPTLHLAY